MTSKSAIVAGLAGLFLVACTGSVEDASIGDIASASSKPVCDPTAPARQSVEPTAKPSLQAKLDAWKAADAAFESVAGVIGRACTVDADCATGDAQLPGRCAVPYYGQAQCRVDAPTAPVITCADYACPIGFECEQERSASVSCVEHRSCVEPGGSSGGGGGGHRGGHHH